MSRLAAALALAGTLICAGPASASGQLAGLQPFFSARLSELLARLPGATITQGYRSPAQSARLYRIALRQHGRAAGWWVAPAGRSMHSFGLAADLHFPSAQTRIEAHVLASHFGLVFPLAWEGWHVEPAGARAMIHINRKRHQRLARRWWFA